MVRHENDDIALQNLWNNLQTPGGTVPFSYVHTRVCLLIVNVVDVPMILDRTTLSSDVLITKERNALAEHRQNVGGT